MKRIHAIIRMSDISIWKLKIVDFNCFNFFKDILYLPVYLHYLT